MLIRDATESDIEPIARTHVDSWRAGYRGLVPDEILDNLSLQERIDLWRRVLANSKYPVILAVEGDLVAGFISIGASRDNDTDPAKTAEVFACYVHPDHWRAGVGHLLWSEAQNRLRTRFSQVTVWTWRDNTRGRRFYERLGFIFDGTE